MYDSADHTHAGLTSEEVNKRISEGKINGEQTVRTKSVAEILRSNLITFFNFIFLVIGVILAFFVRFDMEGIGNFGYVIIIISNSLIGIIQELRAKHTIDKLSLISAPKAKVIRDGEETEIEVKDIVLDDITVLTAGGQICADAVITSGSVEVNESLITGEPEAIVKNPGDEVMSGSFVVSGRAEAKVIHIGLENFAMKISAGAKYFKKPNSAIWRSLNLIVKIMAIAIVPIGIALFSIKFLLQGHELNSTVVNTIGSLIGMIPSGLMLLSSTVFCISVIRLSKHKTLAQDLYCVETLARVDVLCLDKTGTITEGSMEVYGVESGMPEDDFKQIIKNVTSALPDENATANALKAYVADREPTAEAENTVPFSSARKWSGAYVNGRAYIIGAPEFIFAKPTKKIEQKTADMAEQGFRVLALASSANDFVNSKLPKTLRFEGFIYITDKIRAEAPDTLRFFSDQGVNVKIISGDNPKTVCAVARRAGLEDCDNYIDMSTLKNDAEVAAAAEKYTVFGRVLPDQKLMLVKALKARKHTVAMTGDGVNDVLALKEADCSIAMASGSDAAKNVSSLVLLDSNFASMPKVVAEGRRSINNLERSASLFLVKTLYNILLAVMFMIIQTKLPFEPRHLTLIGSVTIGIPSFILALEKNDKRVTGHFLPKVLTAAFPGAITVLLGVGGVVLAKTYFLDVTTEQVQNMCLIITTFSAFLFLFRISLPFNLLHTVLFLAMVGLFVGCYFIEIPFVQDFFGIDREITWQMGQALLSIGAVILPLFVLMCPVFKKLGKRINERIDEKTENKRLTALS